MRWWHIGRRKADLERELQSDLELEEEEQREGGLSKEEAWYAARRAFGNPTLIGEQTREAWGRAPFERLFQDVRYAPRQLVRSPGFAITAVLILALGIGATTAIFSLVEGILLRPLPFFEPDRLVLLGDHLGNNPGTTVTAREIRTYAAATTAFTSTGGYTETDYALSGQEVPEEIHGARLNASIFPTLGVAPILGRVFTQQEEDGHQPLALISYALWMNRYHRDPTAVGSELTLDRRNYTIIGVMPRSFEFPLQTGRLYQSQLWLPLSLTPDELSDDATALFGYHIVGRIKPALPSSRRSKTPIALHSRSSGTTHPACLRCIFAATRNC